MKELYEIIDENYNEEELNELFIEFRLDHNDFISQTKRIKALKLVEYMRRRRRMTELVNQIQIDRDYLMLGMYL